MNMKRWRPAPLPWVVGLGLIALGTTVELARGRALPVLSGERRCLSLARLVQIVRAARDTGAPLPPEVSDLAGIRWVEGVLIDRELNDVVLVGRAGRPSLHLDDLVIALGLGAAETLPYCSLDPRPENVLALQRRDDSCSITDDVALASHLAELRRTLGPQTVVLEGVPRTSRWAHSMVSSDYRLKAIHQGLEPLAGLDSCIQRMLGNARSATRRGSAAEAERSLSRLWFHLADDDPRFVQSETALFLLSCSVCVSTEAQLVERDGTLRDAGRRDGDTAAFAREFSAAFPRMAEHDVDFALLTALYRLLSLCRGMSQSGVLARAGLDLAGLTEGYAATAERPMEETLPPLANGRLVRLEGDGIIHVVCPTVVGGVSMQVAVTSASFRAEGLLARELGALRVTVLDARPALALWWAAPEVAP